MEPWNALMQQGGVLAVLGLLVFVLGRYGIPAAKQVGAAFQGFTNELVRMRETIEEQTEWLRYVLGRMNGVPTAVPKSAPKEPERAE